MCGARQGESGAAAQPGVTRARLSLLSASLGALLCAGCLHSIRLLPTTLCPTADSLLGLPPRRGWALARLCLLPQRHAFLKAPPARGVVAEKIQAGGRPAWVLTDWPFCPAQPCCRELGLGRASRGDQRPLGARSEAARSSTGRAKTVKSLPYFLRKTPQIRESG